MTGGNKDIVQLSDLRSYFEGGCKPASGLGVGLEYERFGVLGRSGVPESLAALVTEPLAPGDALHFEGGISIGAVFAGMIERFGWELKCEDGICIEMFRGPSRITLEPGMQMELSGRVHRSMKDVEDELRGYLREVSAVSRPMGISWFAAGTHPTAPLDRIPWLMKKRYAIMREYLPTRGRLAQNMMKGTCGTQVNLDYTDEADAMDKLRASMMLSSLVTAMFANSPVTAGARNGYLSERAAIWFETDPDRCGLLRFALEPGASFDDYIEYALSVPMFFLARGGRWIPMKGVTFRSFLENGHERERATLEDWILHLTTLFPDVRVKTYIEVRATDSGPADLVLAHTALWKGILYGGPDARRAAIAPLAKLSWEDHQRLHHDVAVHGLAADAGGRPALEAAREIVSVAAAGLAAAGAADEARYLEPLRAMVVERGLTPAELLLEKLGPGGRIDKTRLIDLLAQEFSEQA